MTNKLTAKQSAFIDEYLIDLNASQAALRAGYSKKTAPFIGHENLNKPKIMKAIQEAQAQRRKANKVTRESIAQELDEVIALAKEQAKEGNAGTLTAWLKALDTKAKLFGLYDPQTQINIAQIESRPLSSIFEHEDDEIVVRVVDGRVTKNGTNKPPQKIEYEIIKPDSKETAN